MLKLHQARSPAGLRKVGEKAVPFRALQCRGGKEKGSFRACRRSGFVFSTSNLSISPPFGRSTNRVRAAWPFTKHVREQILQVQGTTLGPDTREAQAEQGPGRAGFQQLPGPTSWSKGKSQGFYWLLQARLLPSSAQPPPSTGLVPDASERFTGGRNENPCDWVCPTPKCVMARLWPEFLQGQEARDGFPRHCRCQAQKLYWNLPLPLERPGN